MPNKNKRLNGEKPDPRIVLGTNDHGIPEVSDVDIAFPCRYQELLPKMEELTAEERAMRGPFCNAVSMLFYKGGRFEDYGIRVKPGIPADKVMLYFRATAGDWGPQHEHKIGGIGHMLAKWCEVVPTNEMGA